MFVKSFLFDKIEKYEKNVKGRIATEELLKKEGVNNCLPGATNLAEAVENYRNFPNYASMELSYGVLALRLEPKV